MKKVAKKNKKNFRMKFIINLIIIVILIIAANKIFKDTYGLLVFERIEDILVSETSRNETVTLERYTEEEVEYTEYKSLNYGNEKIDTTTLSSLIWQDKLNPRTAISSINKLVVAGFGEIPLSADLSFQSTAKAGKTRASYTYANNSKIKTDLSAGISYILAHEKDGSVYVPDKVQQALWLMNTTNPDIQTLRNNTSEYKKLLGEKYFSNFQAANLGLGLYREASTLQEYINESNEFKKANKNQQIVDKMVSSSENKYTTKEAGFVSYSEETKEYIIGPFSVDYVRKVIPAADYSQTKNEDNLVIMGEITEANLYGVKVNKLGQYEHVALDDWEFVYTDVEYDKKTGTATRTAETAEKNLIASIVEQYGIEKEKVGLTKNPYPYPKEVFYIKVKDESLQAITKIEFLLSTMDAVSEVYELEGKYNVVNWEVAEGENGEQIINRIVGAQRNAAKLYQVISSKIIQRQKLIKISLGNVQQNYKPYDGICIPLTMNFAGTVWYEGKEEQEQAGALDGVHTDEAGIKGIEVRLYNDSNELIKTTMTDANGKYSFEYIKIGPKYYVEFEYDGMKYKPTTLLGGTATLQNYIEDPALCSSFSHAIEEPSERLDFNNSFYEITKDESLSENGDSRKLTYSYERYSYTEENADKGTGSIAVLDPIYITASTKTAQIYYPLSDKYSITNATSSRLLLSDKNSGTEEAYYSIGYKFLDSDAYDIYYVTSKYNQSKTEGFKTIVGAKYAKVHNYMQNINLGLVERTPSDFAIVNDVVETRFTLQENVSNSNIVGFAQRSTATDEDFDITGRKGIEEDPFYYYNQIYEQNVGYDSYDLRYDYTDNAKSLENDELQLYLKYKMTIKNQSQLDGYITELVDYYDDEMYYPVDSNEMWRYYDENTNYMDDEQGYADIVIPQISAYSSWAIKFDKNGDSQNIGQVKWSSTSKYGRQNRVSGLNTMYTTSLENVKLSKDEQIVIYVIFKVKRTTRDDKAGLYIINDNADLINDNADMGKQNIVEINGYRGINYNGTDGARVDVDSNPGNTDFNNIVTYEDDASISPYLRVLIDTKDAGKYIEGCVWEDSREGILGDIQENNQIVGNGIIDVSETKINNVKVELIRMEYNKKTGEYEEVSFAEDYEERSGNKIVFYTGVQNKGTGQTSSSPILDEQYRFENLIESGKYKVRFTYGTEEQLEKSLKYNGHDYKSTEYAGNITLSDIENPNTNISIIIDKTDSVLDETKQIVERNVGNFIDKINQLNPNINVQQFEYTDDRLATISLAHVFTALAVQRESNNVIIIFSDGKMEDNEDYRNHLRNIFREDKNIQIYVVGLDYANEDTFRVEDLDYYGLNTLHGSNEQLHISEKLYDVITERLSRKLILVENKSHATDYLENEIAITDTTSKELSGRLRVMQFSQTMTPDTANVLNTNYINSLLRDPTPTSEWSRMTRELAKNTQMTADSYTFSVHFEDEPGYIHSINLGLQEIPKSQIEVNNQVDDIVITLSNGEKLISLKEGKKSNVQVIEESVYSAYLDEELMQGANVEVTYKVTVSNISEVDSLWSYLKYSTYAEKMSFYQKLYQSYYGVEFDYDVSEEILDGILFEAIPVNITRIVDYSDNLIFRAEENNNWRIVNLSIALDNAGQITRDNFQNILFENEPDVYNDRNSIRENTTKWDKATTFNVVDRIEEVVGGYQAAQTTSLENITLYPLTSLNVRNGDEVSSLSSYIKYSKTLSAQDSDIENSLVYNNYLEINETQSINGRRDYEGAPGDYQPATEDTQRDTAIAEKVIILPPFGGKMSISLLVLACVVVIFSGIYFIRRKIV